MKDNHIGNWKPVTTSNSDTVTTLSPPLLFLGPRFVLRGSRRAAAPLSLSPRPPHASATPFPYALLRRGKETIFLTFPTPLLSCWCHRPSGYSARSARIWRFLAADLERGSPFPRIQSGLDPAFPRCCSDLVRSSLWERKTTCFVCRIV